MITKADPAFALLTLAGFQGPDGRYYGPFEEDAPADCTPLYRPLSYYAAPDRREIWFIAALERNASREEAEAAVLIRDVAADDGTWMFAQAGTPLVWLRQIHGENIAQATADLCATVFPIRCKSNSRYAPLIATTPEGTRKPTPEELEAFVKQQLLAPFRDDPEKTPIVWHEGCVIRRLLCSDADDRLLIWKRIAFHLGASPTVAERTTLQCIGGGPKNFQWALVSDSAEYALVDAPTPAAATVMLCDRFFGETANKREDEDEDEDGA